MVRKRVLLSNNLSDIHMKLAVFACLLPALLFFSCGDAPEIESVNTLGTDVQFSMAEYFEPGQRTLSFKFLTQKQFPCINYRIKSDYQMKGEEIHVSLSEVEGADVCLEAVAPAASFLDLGELPYGTYPITLQVGESLTNSGTLVVSEEAYRLVMEATDGLFIQTPEVLRIPPGAVWGRVLSSAPGLAPQATQNLIDRMHRLGANHRTLPEGDYGQFIVDASGSIHLPNAEPESQFFLDYQGETSQLAALVDEVVESYDDAVSVSLHTSGGEEL